MTDAAGAASARLVAREVISSVALANLARLTGARVAENGEELTPAEVARELGVSTATVRRYEERGILAPSRRLPGSRYRRYRRTDVELVKQRIADGDFDQG